MSEPPAVSPLSRPPAALRAFTGPVPPRTAAAPRTVTPPKPARPAEVGENLPMGFMAGLVAAAVGAGPCALVTIITRFQIGWMAVGVGVPVGWAGRGAGRGTHMAVGVLRAAPAPGGCALGNLL